MIFKVPGGTKNQSFVIFLKSFSDASSGTTFLMLLSHLGPFLALHGPIVAARGSQKGSQNHEKWTPEGVSKQGRSPGEAQGLPGGVWGVIWVSFLMVFRSTLGCISG